MSNYQLRVSHAGWPLFVAYISPVSNIAKNHQIKQRCCLNEVHDWFSLTTVWLLIRKSLKQTVVFSTTQFDRFNPKTPTEINVTGSVIPISNGIKILGVTLHRHLSFNAHIQSICKTCYRNIHALRHIRSSLTLDMARTLACIRIGHLSSGLCKLAAPWCHWESHSKTTASTWRTC